MACNVRFLNPITLQWKITDDRVLQLSIREGLTARPIGDHVNCSMVVVERQGWDRIELQTAGAGGS